MNPCPRNKKLLGLLAINELPPHQAGGLRAHLETCPACRRYLDEMSCVVGELRAAAGAAPDLEPSPAFHRRLVQRIETEARPGFLAEVFALLHGRGLNWRVAVPMLAVATVAALFLITARRSGQPVPSPREVIASATHTAGEEAPTFGAYRMLANRSWEALDRELTREASTAPSGTTIYAASSLTMSTGAD
jgi:anti-sigma factor RsiW